MEKTTDAIDYKQLAKLLADELKNCRNCPFGLTEEEAHTVKDIVKFYRTGRTTLIKTLVTTATGAVLALLGWAFVVKIGEMVLSLKK